MTLQPVEPTKYLIKGSYFRTEARSHNEVRIHFSNNPDTFDPLDFLTVPADQVEAMIERIRVGF